MARNILGGFGDMCQADEPEDTRPVCSHCREHFTQSGDLDNYCNGVCWHLDNIGGVKAQILLWFKLGETATGIILNMRKFQWFDDMTDSTFYRWKRAIYTRYEQDRAIIAQAREIENYNDGY